MSDHYATLGVSRLSDEVVIQAAYRALMRKYHPDTNPSPDAARRAAAINEAYAILGDPTRRRAYDEAATARLLLTVIPSKPPVKRVKGADGAPTPDKPPMHRQRFSLGAALWFFLFAVGVFVMAIIHPAIATSTVSVAAVSADAAMVISEQATEPTDDLRGRDEAKAASRAALSDGSTAEQTLKAISGSE